MKRERDKGVNGMREGRGGGIKIRTKSFPVAFKRASYISYHRNISSTKWYMRKVLVHVIHIIGSEGVICDANKYVDKFAYVCGSVCI
jgi:hypothetical protein